MSEEFKVTQEISTQLLETTSQVLIKIKGEMQVSQGNGPIRHVETCPDFFSLQEYTQQNTLSKF
jgi:hypothetical protein